MHQPTRLGQMNTLTVLSETESSYELGCDYYDPDAISSRQYNSVFLDKADRRKGGATMITLDVGDSVEVFITMGTDAELQATTHKPLAFVGECAFLKVLSISKFGAFLDWGLNSDLLLPISEQLFTLREGSSYVVYIHIDDQHGRVIASTKLHHFLDEQADAYLSKGKAVDLLIANNSELGFKAVIDNRYLGLIYHHELATPLRFGSRMKGWVKEIRGDGKIDLSINTFDKETRSELEAQILEDLEANGGRLDLSDKSPPDRIHAAFKVSKNNFKRALSNLYKQRLITIAPDHIMLTAASED